MIKCPTHGTNYSYDCHMCFRAALAATKDARRLCARCYAAEIESGANEDGLYVRVPDDECEKCSGD